jgi:hypothetical protein
MNGVCSKEVPATHCPLGPTSGRGPLKLSRLLRDSRPVLKFIHRTAHQNIRPETWGVRECS